ncbi:MAG TPA: helix-turn-helix domain-containing protein [Bacteroidales bacterium]|nr:helix-turn-helix domain-containing protein [Bacteroidales bacterium]
MTCRIIKPTGILAGVIDYYWIVEHPGNRSVHRELVYPQLFLQMMFYFGSRFTQRHADGTSLQLPPGCICGLKDHYVHVEVTSGFGLLGVVFLPHAARQILGIPVNEMRGINVPLSDWLGRAGAELEERIFQASCHDDRIAILEAFLLGRLSEPSYDQQRIAACIRQLQRKPWAISLKDLAGQACLSDRQFERIFAGFAGTTPKQFHRIARLNHAIEMAGIQKRVNLTSVALASGYYDQAHFNNEFREMTGLSPRQFFRISCDTGSVF